MISILDRSYLHTVLEKALDEILTLSYFYLHSNYRSEFYFISAFAITRFYRSNLEEIFLIEQFNLRHQRSGCQIQSII